MEFPMQRLVGHLDVSCRVQKILIQAVEKTDMRTGLGMYRDRRLAMSIRRRYGVRLGLS
jgi:hypothetical protein